MGKSQQSYFEATQSFSTVFDTCKIIVFRTFSTLINNNYRVSMHKMLTSTPSDSPPQVFYFNNPSAPPSMLNTLRQAFDNVKFIDIVSVVDPLPDSTCVCFDLC